LPLGELDIEDSRFNSARASRVLPLPYLLYWLLWLLTGRGLPAKTARQIDHASKMRRAEKIWALQAVCITAVAVAIYLATMILCGRFHITSR
jgi:hypothetical protein